MTEPEKQHLRDLKAEAARWLRDGLPACLARHGAELRAADPRIADYCRLVAAAPAGHNLYELLKVRRFFELLSRHGFDARRVHTKVRFYEALRFSGTAGRRSYRLTPVQVFQFASIFGLQRADGARLTRLCYIFVPRKFGKTTFAAFLAVDDLLFGDSNAEAYVGANSYDQAKKCFNEVRAIMFDLDPAQRHFRINRELVRFRDPRRDSLVQCLTANAKTKDGLFASLAILDEYAQARNTGTRRGADLKNVLTSSMGPRREPLTVVITTASDVVDGPCRAEIEGAKAVLRGERQNDALFADLFMPDVDDDEGAPATWAKVQPHMGVTVRPDFYEAEWQAAQLSAENRLAFRTKLLNEFSVNEARTWMTWERAESLLGPFDIDRAEGRPPCAVAFDLSVHDDFSAVTYTIYDRATRRFLSHTDYYFPEGSLSGHPNAAQYAIWHEQGHLRFCAGEKIDVKMIASDILRRARRLSIVRIAYDAWKSQELVNILSSVGGRSALLPYSQTYGSFNLPVESFELLAYDRPPRIELNRNPINAWCLANCVIDTDRLENKKPVKAAATRKIDGTITLLMTLGALYAYER